MLPTHSGIMTPRRINAPQHQLHVGIIDNDAWSARAIGQWLSGLGHVCVQWICTKASEGVHQAVFGRPRPDLLLVDMALDGISGVSVCQSVRLQSREIIIFGMTAYDVHQYQDDLAQAGAQGLIPKDQLQHALPRAIQIALTAGTTDASIFPTPTQAHDAFTESSREHAAQVQAIAALSPREQIILQLYDDGLTTEEVALELGVSTHSVFTYLSRAAKKLGTHGRVETLRKCRSFDLLRRTT